MGAITFPFPAATFPLGDLYATAGVMRELSAFELKRGLFWHSQRFWGEVGPEDWDLNDRALLEGTRLLSAFTADNGTKFWIITEADRSSTTVLLPDEY